MQKKGSFVDIVKIMYIPPWRVAATERKLKDFASNGYEPLSFSHIVLSFYRVQLKCTTAKEKDYYLYARFQGGKGPTLGFNSPCGGEERKTTSICHKTLSLTSHIYAAELKSDADSKTVLKYQKEKLKYTRNLYLSFLLLELSTPIITFLIFYLIVPHEIFFREPITVPSSLYPYMVFPIYAVIGVFILTKELKRLRKNS